MGGAGLVATVIVPTFDHGPTLNVSVRSALAQTVEAIEVVVIGDGVPEDAREIIIGLCREDQRVRFVDHPKGPRRGEAYRHSVVADARSEIVCYLADDDLWLPEHVEEMRQLLRHADFANTLPVRVEPDSTIGGWAVDLAESWFRERMLQGVNWIPLSCGAHTADAYRRLPDGWSTTPDGIPTDLRMWQKLLQLPTGVYASGSVPTTLVFPSPDRPGWTNADRCAELGHWAELLSTAEGRAAFRRDVYAAVVRHRAQLEIERDRSCLATDRAPLPLHSRLLAPLRRRPPSRP